MYTVTCKNKHITCHMSGNNSSDPVTHLPKQIALLVDTEDNQLVDVVLVQKSLYSTCTQHAMVFPPCYLQPIDNSVMSNSKERKGNIPSQDTLSLVNTQKKGIYIQTEYNHLVYH